MRQAVVLLLLYFRCTVYPDTELAEVEGHSSSFGSSIEQNR